MYKNFYGVLFLPLAWLGTSPFFSPAASRMYKNARSLALRRIH